MKASETALLDKFNAIIERNFHNPDFGIDEICLELGTSRSHLYRHIKEKTQLSTSLYIRQRKLIKAKELLETTEMRTAEICYLLGIDSPQNFSKYFVQEFGLTPTSYRKQCLEQNTASPDNMHFDEVEIKEVVVSEFQPIIDTRRSKTGFRTYLYSGIGLILSLFLVSFFWKPFNKKNWETNFAPAFSGNSIAIMPFKNLGPPETDYFCEGITDQIQGSLSLINKLKVISSTSSGKYKNSPKLIPQIARELDVNYILEGSVMQSGKKIRILVKLVSASDDRAVWTKSYDGDAKDVFTYLSNVSKEVARELDQKLSTSTAEKFGKAPTSSPAAYNEYLKGSQLIVSRKREHLEESVLRLNKAIEFDPEFAAAYASRGHAYFLLGESGFIDDKTSYKMAEQNSLTAIRLDSENGLAYANLANIYRSQNKWEQARTAYEIALKYYPNDALINYWFSLLLRSTGNMKEAIQYSSKAVALDPLQHVIFSGHIKNCVYGGELDLAKKNIDEGQVLFNDSFAYYWASSTYFAAIGDYKTASEYCAKANQMNPKIRSMQYQDVFYKAMNGQVKEAKDFLTRLPELPENYISRSVVYAGLHDKRQSLYYLQKAADLDIIPTDVKVLPFLAILHGEPQFKSILRKFGL